MFLFSRKIKTEQELDKKSWLIRYEDVQLRKNRLNDSFMSKSLHTLDTKVSSKPLLFELLVFAFPILRCVYRMQYVVMC